MHKPLILAALVAVLLFLACQKTNSNDFFRESSTNSWKHKLQRAEKNLTAAKANVTQCKEKLHLAQLKEIKRHVAKCEKLLTDSSLVQPELPDLFLKEREELLTIMGSEDKGLAKEAEEILNQILRLITHLGTSKGS